MTSIISIVKLRHPALGAQKKRKVSRVGAKEFKAKKAARFDLK